MKSIEKDRKRRYEPPTSLANDIQAHLHGEPVQAAPPSTAYRIHKFVKKHRGSVIAVSVVGLVLLLGIIGTSWGFVQAERNAERQREAKQEAVIAQNQAEGALARGFVRPLVGGDVLAPNEIEALWELATLESDTVGLRMLDEATRNPQMTEQLLICAEPALVAAIGLNPNLRQRALALLRPRLNDPALTLDHRAGIAWITLMLLDKPGPDTAACVTLTKEAIAAVTPLRTPTQLYPINHPERAATLMEPKLVAEFLLAAFADPKPDTNERNRLTQGLHGLIARLEASVVTRITEVLLAELANPKWTSANDYFSYSVSESLIASMDTNTASRMAEALLAAISTPNRQPEELHDIATTLSLVSTQGDCT